MFDFLPSCLRRHKKKLLFLGGVVGGVAFVNTYLKRKFVEWEAQQRAEMNDQINRANHFENSMITCDSVFISATKQIREKAIEEVEVDRVVGELSELKNDPPVKIILWEQLKVLVFTHVIGEMYSQCVLCILFKVQVSILSGYIFSTGSTGAEAAKDQHKYLSQIQGFLLNGVSKLLSRGRSACARVLKAYSLSESLKYGAVKQIVLDIRRQLSSMESEILPEIADYLISSVSDEEENDHFLQKLSQETKDVLECEDFKTVLNIFINYGMSYILDQIFECYSFLSNKGEKFVNINDFEAPLAKLIPVIYNMFSQIEPSHEDALPHRLVQLDQINNFAANIYESFSQKE